MRNRGMLGSLGEFKLVNQKWSCHRDPITLSDDDWGCTITETKRKVFRFHAPILSFGELIGSLGMIHCRISSCPSWLKGQVWISFPSPWYTGCLPLAKITLCGMFESPYQLEVTESWRSFLSSNLIHLLLSLKFERLKLWNNIVPPMIKSSSQT